jgi:hypothetical protein
MNVASSYYVLKHDGFIRRMYIILIWHSEDRACSILIPLASSQHNLYDKYLLLCIQY